jgi:hypothetical protein
MVYVKLDSWWKVDTKEVSKAVVSQVGKLLGDYPERLTQHRDHLRLYSNRAAEGVYGKKYLNTASKQKLTLNIIRSVIDSLVAHYGLERVQPMVVTEGGNWIIQKRAKSMNKFSAGQFQQNKVYRIGPQIIRDFLIHGLGFPMVYEINGDIKFERIFPAQMIFDEVEASEGNPRHAYRARDVSRETMLEMQRWKKHAGIIKAARKFDCENWFGAGNDDEDRITLFEAWRLPSEDGNTKGRYVCTLDNGVIEDVEYEEQRYPFTVARMYGDDGQSWWPSSMVDNLESIQIEVNYLLQKAQRQMKSASFKVLAERSSRVIAEHLTNEDGTILYYTGTPPQWATMQAVAPETFQQIMQLKQDAFAQEGLNQLSSQGLIPPGIKSGKAQQIYLDEGSKRLRYHGRAVEDMYCDVADRMFDCARRIEERGEESYEVRVEESGKLSRIRWKECDLEKDQYIMSIQPTNYFASTPSARIEQALELFDRQLITVEQFASMSDMPDLSAIMAHSNAPYDEIMQGIALMREGDNAYPSPYTDMALAGQLVQRARVQAQVEGAPDTILELFDQYLLTLHEYENKATEEQQAQQQPAPGPAPSPQGPMPGPGPEGMPPQGGM